MGGYYYFNCNGPVRVDPYANFNEALQEAEDLYGGPCQFLSCSIPPCGAPSGAAPVANWEPDAEFLRIADERKLQAMAGREGQQPEP
jgi:hypothetical protein